MDTKGFVRDYIEAFGTNTPLPVAFWHSDEPVAEPETVNGCFFPVFEKIREGVSVSFDATTMKCGGGKFYCGLAPMPDYVPTFVSEKEHYKTTPQLVKDFVESLDIHVDGHRYLNFQTIDKIGGREDYYGVLILASPDVLSGLVSWACYDNTNPDAVCAPWGSGCSSTLRAVMNENSANGQRCFIGLFDPSVRPRVRAGELMFGIPKCRLDKMVAFIRETCLFNGLAWPKVRDRINAGAVSK